MKKKICFFSFLLPFLSMMAIFIGNGIYPFGDQSFMHSDMYHQYVPFLEEFVRKVRDGEPLYYSWRIGMGSNYLSLYGYYSASPFNWLMLLLPEKYLIEFMSYMVVFKIGLRKKIQPLLHHPRAVHFIELLPFHHGLHLPVPVLSRARTEPVWL